VRATSAGEIWEIRRNVLDRNQCVRRAAGAVQKMYRERALDVVLANGRSSKTCPKDEYQKCVNFLRPKSHVRERQSEPTDVPQGDWADAMYLVRLGHVKVQISRYGTTPRSFIAGRIGHRRQIGLLAIEPGDMGEARIASTR